MSVNTLAFFSKRVLFYFSYYDATVDSISDDFMTCTVSFNKYGNTEIVKVGTWTVMFSPVEV